MARHVLSGRRVPGHMPSRQHTLRHFAFQTQSVKAYFFQMMSVKACDVRTMHATVCAFLTTSARAFCLPDVECHGIFLADDQCQGICLLDTVRQGISIDACHRIYFRTALAGAHTAPNPCRVCVCVLDQDGRCSSLLDNDCQSDTFSFCRCMSSMWHPDDTRHGMCFSDDECQGILPSRRRVSGHSSSRQ